MFELAKDPLTKPDLGWADVGSVNLVSYDPATHPMGSDIGKSCAERIREISAICAHDVSLWVRTRRRIARSRADFAQFSEMSGNRETGWWEGSEFELSGDFLNGQ
jgi:hypothetical protein